MYDATKCGLNHWFKHEFEHLGWMVLAKEKSMDMSLPDERRKHMADKVKLYCDSVTNLMNALAEKIEEVSNVDDKKDLAILMKNVKTLKSFISSTLMGSQMGGKRHSRKSKKSKKTSRK